MKMQRITRNHVSSFAAALLFAVAGTSSAEVLFTTQTDWAQWTNGANIGTIGTAGDTDFSTINGGWSSAPGDTGPAGALTITINGGYSQTAMWRASSDRLLLSGKTVTLDHTTTGVTGGNYFQILIFMNTDGYWGGTAATSSENMGSFTRSTYTLPTFETAGSYFEFGVVANTNSSGTFTIDNLQFVSVPEPHTVGLLFGGGIFLLVALRARTRRALNA